MDPIDLQQLEHTTSSNTNNRILVEPININDVINLDKTRFNTNNHWFNDTKPLDYEAKIEANKTANWIKLFKSNYKTITIDNEFHIGWMKKANEISSQTGKFSKLFADELELFENFFYNNYSDVLDRDNKVPYFVRSENVSLKYGEHKTGPYYNIKQIVESLVSSVHGHSPIYPDTNKIILYLIPWEPAISNSNEFRVFVNSNRITSISQQALYSKFVPEIDIKYNSVDELIRFYAQVIIDYFESDIKNKITWSDSYSFDIAIVKKNNLAANKPVQLDPNQFVPIFIEPNGFGAEYATGSALFHWIHDKDKLYGLINSPVYIRYTC